MDQTIPTPLHQIVLVGIEAECPVLHGAREKRNFKAIRKSAKGESGIARTFFMVTPDPTNRSRVGDRICHMKQ